MNPADMAFGFTEFENQPQRPHGGSGKSAADLSHRERQTGQISDELAKHFFAIWLDPRTSEPNLRQALLGAKR